MRRTPLNALRAKLEMLRELGVAWYDERDGRIAVGFKGAPARKPAAVEEPAPRAPVPDALRLAGYDEQTMADVASSLGWGS